MLVVAGGCRCLLVPCVQDSVSFLFGKSIHVNIRFVRNRHCISLRLGDYCFHVHPSVILYVDVGSSNRSLIGVPLHVCHEHRSSSGRKARGPVGSRSRACCTWWQEGVDVSRVCKIRSLFCLKNPFMSPFGLSVSYILFLPWLKYYRFHVNPINRVMPYVNVDSSYSSLSGVPIYNCHEDRSFPGRKARGPAGGRGRACRTWWQEGVEVFFSRVCNNQSLFGKSIHVMICFVSKRHCT